MHEHTPTYTRAHTIHSQAQTSLSTQRGSIHVCSVTHDSQVPKPHNPHGSSVGTGVLYTHVLVALFSWGGRGRAICPLVMIRDWAGGWGWAGAGRGAGAAGE